MAKNIEKRRNVWFATLHVPKDARDRLGRAKFFETLKTTDKRIAEGRALSLVATWKAQIQQARGQADPFIAEALKWGQAIRREKNEDTREAVEGILLDHLEDTIEPKHGTDRAKTFADIVFNPEQVTALLMTDWKARLNLEPKTIDQMVKDVGRMAERFPTVAGIDRKAVLDWLRGLAGGNTQTPSSIRRIAGSCRNFWRYLQESGKVPEGKETPFADPSHAKASKRRGTGVESWIPFKPEDVVSLYQMALNRGDQQVADLIALGAFTGARIEELCSVKLADLDGVSSFKITDAKTDAGRREVPIHSKLGPVIERLIASSRDNYLLSGLTFNKYGDRSNAIGKRFGRLKTAMGFEDRHVFHSIRKTMVTLLEDAGVRENLTADIVGHEKKGITYGVYSGGNSMGSKREAIELISYPGASATLGQFPLRQPRLFCRKI